VHYWVPFHVVWFFNFWVVFNNNQVAAIRNVCVGRLSPVGGWPVCCGICQNGRWWWVVSSSGQAFSGCIQLWKMLCRSNCFPEKSIIHIHHIVPNIHPFAIHSCTISKTQTNIWIVPEGHSMTWPLAMLRIWLKRVEFSALPVAGMSSSLWQCSFTTYSLVDQLEASIWPKHFFETLYVFCDDFYLDGDSVHREKWPYATRNSWRSCFWASNS